MSRKWVTTIRTKPNCLQINHNHNYRCWVAYKQIQSVTTNWDDGEWPTSQSCHCHAASSIIYSRQQTGHGRVFREYIIDFSGSHSLLLQQRRQSLCWLSYPTWLDSNKIYFNSHSQVSTADAKLKMLSFNWNVYSLCHRANHSHKEHRR